MELQELYQYILEGNAILITGSGAHLDLVWGGL